MIERIKTGIPGFDQLVQGGLVKGSTSLVTGGTGTCKTLFSMQFLYSGAVDFGEKGIYISFEESEEDLKSAAESIGINFSKAGKKAKFICLSPYDTIDFISLLKDEITRFGAKRVVIDSITALAMPLDNNFERKKMIFTLNKMLKKMKCSCLLVSEIPSEGSISSESLGRFSRFGVEEFLCDSVIMLHYMGIGGEADRAARVVKMRKTSHKKGPIPMEIGNKGIKILKPKY